MLNVMQLDPPKDSKVTRANSIAPICESKRVRLVDGGYIENFVNQLAAFPYSARMDMTDCLVYAVQRFLQKTNNPDLAFISF